MQQRAHVSLQELNLIKEKSVLSQDLLNVKFFLNNTFQVYLYNTFYNFALLQGIYTENM